jgi:hypothetical protein
MMDEWIGVRNMGMDGDVWNAEKVGWKFSQYSVVSTDF